MINGKRLKRIRRVLDVVLVVVLVRVRTNSSRRNLGVNPRIKVIRVIRVKEVVIVKYFDVL